MRTFCLINSCWYLVWSAPFGRPRALTKFSLLSRVHHLSFMIPRGFSSIESLVTKREYRRETRKSRKKITGRPGLTKWRWLDPIPTQYTTASQGGAPPYINPILNSAGGGAPPYSWYIQQGYSSSASASPELTYHLACLSSLEVRLTGSFL